MGELKEGPAPRGEPDEQLDAAIEWLEKHFDDAEFVIVVHKPQGLTVVAHGQGSTVTKNPK